MDNSVKPRITKKKVIEARALYKHFDWNSILNDFHLDVYEGEVLVIIGRSGSGKSVFLKHIIGLMKPDQGELFVHGENVGLLKQKQLYELRMKVGMLFQGAALFDSMTVRDNVAFSLLEHTKMDKGEIDRLVAEKLAMVGLSDIEHFKPAELSGGMKKRVGLARAICNNPSIMLYDEPTTGLDPIMSDVINDLIIDLNRKLGVTSIAVTHDMTSAYKIADRIAMLYNGRIVGIGTPEEIKATDDPIISQFITGRAEGPITRGFLRRRGVTR